MKVILNANQASLPPNINPLQPRKVHQFQVSMLPPSPDPPTKDQLLCYTWSHCLEEPGWLQTMESPRVGHNWATSLSHTGVGNGNTLQCSCLENPRDGEPGGLPSMGSHRVGQYLAAAAAIWFIFLYTTPKYGSFSRLTEIQPSSLSFYSAPSTIYWEKEQIL